MSWNKLYALRSYLRSSLWIVPFFALVLQQILFRTALVLEEWTTWVPRWPLGTEGTVAAMQAIISLALSFIVFTFGSLLVAIQIASGQLTPRIIATTLLRDNVIRFTVGLFIFTLLFAIGVISRVNTSAPSFIVWFSGILGVASLAAFLYFIDYSARLLRPVSIIHRVAEQGFEVLNLVYPAPLAKHEEGSPPHHRLGEPARIVAHLASSAIILAVDVKALTARAQRADGIIELSARIGDFVSQRQPLFRLHGGAAAVPDHDLRRTVAFGRERTIEQDPTFAFRVIVDIASKALSKAINDPTTAVLAIDQLHRLLRSVGRRQLGNEYIRDAEGCLRVVLPTPDWEDFVQLTCREIRIYGTENLQIARRLRAMIENLDAVLPETRKPALRLERDLLDRMIEKVYLLPEDAALARIADTQGLGGSAEKQHLARCRGDSGEFER
ncbi:MULTISPECIES: DUF2254 domain-containing protein [Rhizobium]|uniref:DUF2254 domain-containing protein n=1 Tax=Rhizobium favelukesii TaxID=348824 RepID=W6RK07_9HYPH|nr:MULTISPECIES: DUF2254 domain-containing protein [Rhizobium]MCA0806692.1 DUF2254 domain-containing protein [Rhizobium sp. T1473]MCS0462399.1 DUF2254 domain-containing protein [Rhizobium favelukesii]UFS85212.1 DUF2254 domain-containing protein [Rhizobium sp. T136]CDM61199.1 putative protein Mb1321c [Rhizobium favelukesii]